MPRSPRPAIPAPFDTLLTRTIDHAAARAVEAALRRAGVAFHLTDDGGRAGRIVEIFVRDSDVPRAAPIAGRIFARRHKLKSFPRQQIPRNDDSTASGWDYSPLM